MTPSILIVDDESGIVSLLTLHFSAAGYSVHTAEDGREAMQICRSERFDAVLSDVVMPELGGHDLARWLATYYPATEFILMTGWDTGCENCPIAGRCSILPKPFAPKDAVARVNAILAKQRWWEEKGIGSRGHLAIRAYRCSTPGATQIDIDSTVAQELFWPCGRRALIQTH